MLVGSLKALIIKLLLPFYCLIAAYILYQFGLDKIDDVLLAFSNSLVMLVCSALLSKRYMPFSIAQDALSQNNTSRGILIAVILGVVGFCSLRPDIHSLRRLGGTTVLGRFICVPAGSVPQNGLGKRGNGGLVSEERRMLNEERADAGNVCVSPFFVQHSTFFVTLPGP